MACITAIHKRLVLTHFDANVYASLPERRESEAVASAIFADTIAATDGLRINL